MTTTRASARTTATMKSAPATLRSVLWLHPGLVVRDAIGRVDYRIVRFLGRGGFGAAYEAVRLPIGGRPALTCVLKVTLDAPAWHREAYFGHLLRRVPALVEVYGSFAWAPRTRSGVPLYCLVSEHMANGNLGDYLRRNPAPWTEHRARREIVRLLRALTRIHQSGAVHRDITPGNVFVGADGSLKLGDFGIALHRVGRQEVAADAFAPHFAPTSIREGAKSWRAADDVNQLGQLYATLLSGVVSRKLTAAEIKRLPCSAECKSVLQRCAGERRKCFSSAAEMLDAIVREPAPAAPRRVLSLTGKRIVFTGPLRIPRAEARRLARKAGAILESQVSQSTDCVVVGRQSPNWKAEAKGQKLLDVDREAERGHRIALLTESRFLALVRPATTSGS